jgi:hypothetical protein
VHLVVDEIYSTDDFTHSHPKLESFAVLKKQHMKQHESRVHGHGTG